MSLAQGNQRNDEGKEKRYTYTFVEEPLDVNITQDVEDTEEDDSDEITFDDIPYEEGTEEYREELDRRFKNWLIRRKNEILREHPEYAPDYVKPYSFVDQIKNIDKLNLSERIDLACGIALVPCAVGISFAWLFAGVIVNSAFWALNFWVFSGDLRFGCEWMLIPLTIILDLVIFIGGWIIFKKWWFLILAISFGLALWVFNM